MKLWYGWSLLVAMAFAFFPAPDATAEIFKYIDADGRTHYVDSFDKVPKRYRHDSEEKDYGLPKPTPKSAQGRQGAPSFSAAPVAEPPPATKKPKLKRIVLPYKPFSDRGARRIIIPVTFNGSVTAPMIFDTGAPGLLISLKLAKRLGLFDGRGGVLKIRTGGVGGSVDATRTILDSLSVGSATDNFIPTTITDASYGEFEGLVGMALLANYTMTVDSHRNLLIFEEIPGSTDRPGGHDKRWWKQTYWEFGGQRKKWSKAFTKYNREIALADKEARSYTRLKKKWKEAREQKTNADKLFRKLEQYAAHSNVPMHWRKY